MRILWCYGSERFWNFCGRTIKDRGHPLANFIKSINARRAVDSVPRAFVAELLSHAAEHTLNYITEAVEYAVGVPKPAALSIQTLFASLDLRGSATPVAPELLLPAFKQLSFKWESISYEIRTPPLCVCDRVWCVCVCVCVWVGGWVGGCDRVGSVCYIR